MIMVGYYLFITFDDYLQVNGIFMVEANGLITNVPPVIEADETNPHSVILLLSRLKM